MSDARLNRRGLLRSLGLGATWLAMPPALRAAQAADDGGPATRKERAVLLTRTGSDRATGYLMSNKIVRGGDRLLCTWLARSRQNHWALADRKTGQTLRQGSVGAVLKDNHCGAAVAAEPDGTLHLVTGGHFSDFCHYTMAARADADWQQAEVVHDAATYPSLACDRRGTLHLAYRCGPVPYKLKYRTRPKGGRWSQALALVQASVREHTWLTNAIALGPEGHVHLVFSNTRALPDLSYCYGASHICSTDSGATWRQLGADTPLSLPAEAARLALIDQDALRPDRTHSRDERAKWLKPGPLNYYYNEILLSNPVTDDAGRPSAVVHDNLRGEAALFRARDGSWTAMPLHEEARRILPGFLVQGPSSLSRHADGTLEVLLTLRPASARGWGAPGTALVRVLVGPGEGAKQARLVREPEPGLAHWLPSLEHWSWNAPSPRPALVYTRGINAGGYANNVNPIETEVWLEMP
ncbi:MAG TPA: BNR-4 repeat-containing protein [Planctomycetota bacterium]|nr:BNR-4 repeat-containing protein [Planctomycetota bacterium]